VRAIPATATTTLRAIATRAITPQPRSPSAALPELLPRFLNFCQRHLDAAALPELIAELLVAPANSAPSEAAHPRDQLLAVDRAARIIALALPRQPWEPV
jgi:hypothetical protein